MSDIPINKFVAIVPCFYVKGILKVLLVHHKASRKGQKNFNSYWAFPGGGAYEGETSEVTGAREIKEETSIQVEPKSLANMPHVTKEVTDDEGSFIGHKKVFILYFCSDNSLLENLLSEDADLDAIKVFEIDRLPTGGESNLYSKITRSHFIALKLLFNNLMEDGKHPTLNNAINEVIKSLDSQRADLRY